MIRVYVRGDEAPWHNPHQGWFYRPTDDKELLELVARLGSRIVEIEIRGVPGRPPTSELGFGVRQYGQAWALYSHRVFCARGTNVEEVMVLSQILTAR